MLNYLTKFTGRRRRRSSMAAAACLSLVTLALGSFTLPATGSDTAGTASVIDGDTIEIHGERIRLHGIDSPEGRQLCLLGGKDWRCGTAAANALSELIARSPVSCEVVDIDRYKRLVAICEVRGTNINDWMVRNGWAMAYRQYSKAYNGAEAEARSARRGIWASEFDAPWDWRKARR